MPLVDEEVTAHGGGVAWAPADDRGPVAVAARPLRRTSDLVEAWVLLAAWVLAVVGGAVVGAAMAVVADRA
ncbi:hypothetical protein ACQF4J_04690 [Streptomyces sp. C1-1]|uniref:hypothetical protein n=1 Tax=Streptomyces sp. C1-1 TaxID=3231173 RepID=UPI003D0759BC